MPPLRRDGRLWSGFQVLAPGARTRLLAYEQQARQRMVHWARPLVFDLGQDVPYAGIKVSGFMPALLRRSQPWGSHARRYLLPAEALQVQGIGPVYKPEDYMSNEQSKAAMGSDDGSSRLPLYDAVAKGELPFSDSQVRSLAGNSMPVPMIAAASLMVLSCTEKI